MGVDKSRVRLADGSTMVDTVIAAVLPVAREVYIVRRGTNEARWPHPSGREIEVITDIGGDTPHPLWGLATALERSTTAFALVVACDVPHVPTCFIRRLVELRDPRGLIAAAGEAVHPLIGLYPVEMAEAAVAGARAGISMRAFARGCVRVQGEPDWFTNINTPSDLG
jgi:molybdopterin-guanine dinucleotide biosynthesis protein A